MAADSAVDTEAAVVSEAAHSEAEGLLPYTELPEADLEADTEEAAVDSAVDTEAAAADS